jgi:glycosyltransferase involved in cell wall biosynthesis
MLESLSCILLAYNEEDVIAQSLARLEAAAKQVAQQYELIVVGYEGARDRTNDIVRDLAVHNSRIRLVIQKREESGYGRAMMLGIRTSRMQWIFQSDADGQYDFAELNQLVARISDPDVVFVHGYRQPRRDSVERLLFAFLYNTAIQIIYHAPVRDIDSAFKLMRGDLARAVPIRSLTGFAVTELIMRIYRRGGKVVQMRVTHLPRVTGEALSDKGVANPLGLQLPKFRLVRETLGEMMAMRKDLRAPREGT